MINAILNGLLTAISSLLNILLLPINLLFENLFPDLSTYIGTFNTFVETYLGGSLGYFGSMFPPIFKGLLVAWFSYVATYYSVRFIYNNSIKLFNVIQKLKFW